MKPKFRAWHKTFEKYVDYLTGLDFVNECVYWEERTEHYEGYDIDKEHYSDFDDVIIEQYTGLKYKDGKEIYVGDIVKWGSYYFKVENDIEHPVIHLVNKSNETMVLWACIENIEVIGSINENKDLLEGSD